MKDNISETIKLLNVATKSIMAANISINYYDKSLSFFYDEYKDGEKIRVTKDEKIAEHRKYIDVTKNRVSSMLSVLDLEDLNKINKYLDYKNKMILEENEEFIRKYVTLDKKLNYLESSIEIKKLVADEIIRKEVVEKVYAKIKKKDGF